MAKTDPNVITDLHAITSESDREAVDELLSLSRHLVRARKTEAVAKDQREDVWTSLQASCVELNADIAFLLDGVKLTWKRGGEVATSVPDEQKIAEVAPELLVRQAKLKADLAEVEFELQKLGETHTRIEQVYKKPGLTVTESKPKVAAKR
ncbi:hypothetical protein ACXR2T_10085 [Leucobacter sp. HY1910]